LSRISLVLAVGVVICGWFVAVGQLTNDGWTSGGGTAWLLVCACVATIGASFAVPALIDGRHGWAAAGLALVIVSPTGFAYPFNALVLVLAIVHLAMALSRRSVLRPPAH
jgi:hypothetical protein